MVDYLSLSLPGIVELTASGHEAVHATRFLVILMVVALTRR